MNRSRKTPQPLIWINGWPAVGKQTVGQCLMQILGHDRAVLIDECQFTDHLSLPPQGGRPRGNSCSSPRGPSDSGPGGPYPVQGPENACRGRAQQCRDGNRNGRGTRNGNGKKNSVESSTGGDPAAYAQVHDPSCVLFDKRAACFEKYVQDPVSGSRLVIFTNCSPDTAEGKASAHAYAEAARRAGRPFVPIYMNCCLEENARRMQTSERKYSQAVGKMRNASALRALRARHGDKLFLFPNEEQAGLSVDVSDQTAHKTAMQILAFSNRQTERYVVQEPSPPSSDRERNRG